jgi:uncharacterized phage protein (TIGR01671 family)
MNRKAEDIVMRQHKYKAFYEGKMWTVWRLEWDQNGRLCAISLKRGPHMEYWFVSTSGQISLLKSIGLKDKNGREIYEGDIVLVDNKFLIGVPLMVEWSFEEGQYHAIPQGKKKNLAGLKNIYDSPCKIIGNIHESPELLK